jgi:hypothetical protein
MVRSVVGQVAGTADFFDRVQELHELRDLGMREHVLLLAPRRVGKTSLLHRLATTLNEEADGGAVYASVQGAVDELDFLRSIHTTAARHSRAQELLSSKHRFKKLLGRVSEIDLAGFAVKLESTSREHWQDRARELTQALASLPGHWFLLVDELPVFIARLLRDDPSTHRARVFLEWFRSVRQKSPGVEVSLHWILAGSIGLDVIAHRHGLTDTVNDLTPMRLGAFSTSSAREFLASLSSGERVPLGAEVIVKMVDRIGWPIPYHLQVLFAEIHRRYRATGVAIQEGDVEDAFACLLQQHSYFDSWHERLADELGEPSAGYARTLLSACAADPTGCSRAILDAHIERSIPDSHARSNELRFLLDNLQHDGYLHERDGRYAFRSELLREFWKRRYA